MRQALVQKWLRSSIGIAFNISAAIIHKGHPTYQECSFLGLSNPSKAAERGCLGQEMEVGCGRMATTKQVDKRHKGHDFGSRLKKENVSQPSWLLST